MLEQLIIENLAIITRTVIHFQAGLNVLSGETGAGKSILIDALSLILGDRAEASTIRHGADKAYVAASFEDIPHTLQQTLQQDGLDNSEASGICLIRRNLRSNGSKAWLNDHPVTAAKLRSLSAALVGIHGQHANQALLKTDEQRRRLDRFAGHGDVLAAVAEAYRKWQALEKAWQLWLQQRQENEERLSLLTYQLAEFEELAPQEDEFALLAAEQHRLANVDHILDCGHHLLMLLQDGEQALGAGLRQARQLCEKLGAMDERFMEARDLLEQSLIYTDESTDVLNRYLGRIEHDPVQLADIEARMTALHALARKQRCQPDELYQRWQALQHEYHRLMEQSTENEQLDNQRIAALQYYQESADRLSASRAQAAVVLGREVEGWIRQLGMQHAVFQIELHTTERPAIHGQDDVRFLLCANPGQTLHPLHKVASGGELSRVSLAIEVSCLDELPVPTIIFDEIDAGIGGEVADVVGQLLHRLSQNRQVLCITHLPQVAAYADHHYRIEKNSDKYTTSTTVTPLDDEARIVEIARMLGAAQSDTSREHARAMLNKRKMPSSPIMNEQT